MTQGDVVSVSAFGQRIVILNSLDAAIDLLDKRGAFYSDRPVLTMVGKLMGWAQQLVLLPLGESFRNQRRFLHRHLGSRNQLHKIEQWHELIENEVHVFLGRTLTSKSSDIVHNLHRCVASYRVLVGEWKLTSGRLYGSIVLSMGYGYKLQEGQDPLIALVNRALDGFQEASTPGNFLVDVIPACTKASLPEAALGANSFM